MILRLASGLAMEAEATGGERTLGGKGATGRQPTACRGYAQYSICGLRNDAGSWQRNDLLGRSNCLVVTAGRDRHSTSVRNTVAKEQGYGAGSIPAPRTIGYSREPCRRGIAGVRTRSLLTLNSPLDPVRHRACEPMNPNHGVMMNHVLFALLLLMISCGVGSCHRHGGSGSPCQADWECQVEGQRCYSFKSSGGTVRGYCVAPGTRSIRHRPGPL